MKSSIRIGAAQGFWGDRRDAPETLARHGRCDYLMLDYLAEVTMSILQRQKMRDPSLGYAKDFPHVAGRLAPYLDKGLRVVTNAGGVNPVDCAHAVVKELKRAGLSKVKVGVVTGDDILSRIDALIAGGDPLKNMETGELLDSVRSRLVSANVYFGAAPLVEALAQGAQVVVAGRVTDTALTLAPMVHEFGWAMEDYRRVAAGTVAGHIMECGAQASGGNFCAGWEDVPDMARIGYPVAEAYPDGTFVITKPETLGGLVNQAVVKEQLLYELGDPRRYISPDCVIDFTSLKLSDDGKDRVRVTSVKGGAPTDTYKVSIAYRDGWTASGTLTYTWPDALKKARKAKEILETRFKDQGLRFEDVRFECLGLNACHGALAKIPDEKSINEIVFRVAVRDHHKHAVEAFGYELAPLILDGPPSVTGFAGGRPKPSEIIAYWPALLRKSAVSTHVEIVED